MVWYPCFKQPGSAGPCLPFENHSWAKLASDHVSHVEKESTLPPPPPLDGSPRAGGRVSDSQVLNCSGGMVQNDTTRILDLEDLVDSGSCEYCLKNLKGYIGNQDRITLVWETEACSNEKRCCLEVLFKIEARQSEAPLGSMPAAGSTEGRW